jgi:hypothetical protein
MGSVAGVGVHPQELRGCRLPAACIQHDAITPGGYQLSCPHHALHIPARFARFYPHTPSTLFTAAFVLLRLTCTVLSSSEAILRIECLLGWPKMIFLFDAWR